MAPNHGGLILPTVPLIMGVKSPAVAGIPANAYNAYYSDTGNVTVGNSYTFNVSSIGADHAQKVVVVAIMQSGTSAPSAVTILGQAATNVDGGATGNIWYAACPAGGTSGTVVVTIAGGTSGRCSIDVWTIYPSSATPLDHGTGTGTTSFDVANIEIVVGGYLVWLVSAATNALDFTITWNGTDTPVEDGGDRVLEAAHTTNAGHIVCTQASTTLDLTNTEAANTSRRATVVSWGAQ